MLMSLIDYSRPAELTQNKMMPHQSQGACMAIEDAAALGILFSENYFSGDVQEALAVYDAVRLPRVTRVQSAAAKAAYNINERIGELNWEMAIDNLALTVICV